MIKLGEVVSPIVFPIVFENIEDVFSVNPKVKYKHEMPSKKCALPECDKLTNHRGGYCCAEHKHMHKLLLKK